jgi:hypothetical protein
VWIPAAKSKRRSSAGACGSDLPAAFSGEPLPQSVNHETILWAN